MVANTPQSNEQAYIERKAAELVHHLRDRVSSISANDHQENRRSVTEVAQSCQSAILANPHLTSLFLAMATGQRGAVAGSQVSNADIQTMLSMASMWAFKAALQFYAYQDGLSLMDYKGCTFLVPAPSKEDAEKNGKIILG